jgi:hypothetical protein
VNTPPYWYSNDSENVCDGSIISQNYAGKRHLGLFFDTLNVSGVGTSPILRHVFVIFLFSR